LIVPHHVAGVDEAEELRALGQQVIERIQVEQPLIRHRHIAQGEAELVAQDLPGHDVGVVLHLGDEHLVARAQIGATPGVGHQVDALRRAAGEDHLAAVGRVDEAGDLLPRALEGRGGFLAQRVHPAVNVGIVAPVVVVHGLDHRHRLLAARRIVQVDQRRAAGHRALEDGEILPNQLRAILHFYISRRSCVR
jgi:hypothetical protein